MEIIIKTEPERKYKNEIRLKVRFEKGKNEKNALIINDNKKI